MRINNYTRISNEIFSYVHVSNADCLIYRSISMGYFIISILSFALNIRFILIDYHRLNSLIISLIINSFVLIIFSFPYVSFQAIQCLPIESYFICTFEGFICFTCGICVMYTMCSLSLAQYVRLFYNTTIVYRMIEHKNSYLIPIICWLISLSWSLPPLFDINPGFMREAQGFDCGLNWKRSDSYSHFYILLAFTTIYFVPFLCLVITHLHILIIIRKLVSRQYPVISRSARSMSVEMHHSLFYKFNLVENNRLKRLRIDRKFAQATMITVLYYILSWTPYTIFAIIQTIGTMYSFDYQLPFMLITASALTAKIAVIGQSCVYFYTVRPSDKRSSITSATLK